MVGLRVEKEENEAMKYLKISAYKGYTLSCSWYGQRSPEGDPNKLLYFKKAAEQHEINGEFLYGNMLINDTKSGTIETGIKHLKSAADRGY